MATSNKIPLNLFYKRPRLLVLTLFLILVSGFSAYKILPRLEDPEIRQRWALILTSFPGADAERVEALVSEKIEEEILELAEIRRTFSNSRNNISVIRVILKDSVIDTDYVWSRIRDKLSDVTPQLPPGASEPELKTDGLRAYTFIASIRWDSPNQTSYGLLNRLSQELEARLARVSGTQYADTVGIPDEEILVQANRERLTALGMSVEALAQNVKLFDAKVAAGQVRNKDQNLLIEVAGEFDSLERIRQIPVTTGQAGATVPLQQIATVSKTTVNPPSSLAMIDGKAGVAVAARMLPNQRVDLWAARVKKVFAKFAEELPPGLSAEILFDQSRYTANRLNSLQFNLIVGALLVVTVVLLMMGWKSALIVGSALPLSSLMVLAGMNFLGIPMHQMSITGLIIALGLLIDNAIVVVDEVRMRFHKGMSTADAISDAVGHLVVPLIGSTLTTVFAFMPLVLLPGGAGEFVGSIGMTVILALLSSLFLALTVVPALTGLIQDIGSNESESFLNRGLSIPALSQGYTGFLKFLFRYPAIGIGMSLIIPIMGFYGATTLREQFFPPADRDQFQIQLRLPFQSSIEATTDLTRRVREVVIKDERVTRVHAFIGTNAPMFYYNLVPGQNGNAFYAQLMVQLDGPSGSKEIIHRIQKTLDTTFPQVQSLVLQLEQGPPFEAPIELRIIGPDLDRLHELGLQARALLHEIPEVEHTLVSMTDGLPKVSFEVNENVARVVNLHPVSIAAQLQANLEGVVAGSIVEGSEELPVRVRLSGDQRKAVDRISSLEIMSRSNSGTAGMVKVPLANIAQPKLEQQRANIFRFLGRRCNTVQAHIHAGVLPAVVQKQFKKKLAKLDLPDGYELEFGGEAAERDDAVGNLLASVSLLLVLMVATLVLSFSSFRLASIIGMVGFLSIGLGLCALWLAGYPFGFMAIVGTMGLVGVAINDAIVVLAAIREHPVARTGDAAAVLEVVLEATRHVLSTTLTTMFGFIPLLMEGGGFWPPLAISIAGGVAGATALALTFTPCCFIVLQRWRGCVVGPNLPELQTPNLSDMIPETGDRGALLHS